MHLLLCCVLAGDVKVALYGLGNVKDDRLYRAFNSKKVYTR